MSKKPNSHIGHDVGHIPVVRLFFQQIKNDIIVYFNKVYKNRHLAVTDSLATKYRFQASWHNPAVLPECAHGMRFATGRYTIREQEATVATKQTVYQWLSHRIKNVLLRGRFVEHTIERILFRIFLTPLGRGRQKDPARVMNVHLQGRRAHSSLCRQRPNTAKHTDRIYTTFGSPTKINFRNSKKINITFVSFRNNYKYMYFID